MRKRSQSSKWLADPRWLEGDSASIYPPIPEFLAYIRRKYAPTKQELARAKRDKKRRDDWQKWFEERLAEYASG